MAPATYANVVRIGHAGAEVSNNAPQAPPLEGFTIPRPAEEVLLKKSTLEMKIDRQVESFNTTPSAPVEPTAYRGKLSKAEEEFRKMLRVRYPDAQIWLAGSYAAGIDLEGSDLDFTLKIPSLEEVHGKHKLVMMGEKMEEEQNLFSVLKVIRGKVWVLKLTHKATSTDVDVTIDNDPPKRNTQLLRWYSEVDSRFAPLCRSVKSWARGCGVENSKDGRLNSFSICLMLIHFLQKVFVLPNLQAIFPEINEEDSVIPEDGAKRRNLKKEIENRRMGEKAENKKSLGALYMGFFEYYSSFDFKTRCISIKNGTAVRKTRRDGSFIHVEDPFILPRHNCAGTVRVSDIYDRIVLEFQKQLTRIQAGSICSGYSIRRRAIVAAGKELNSADEGGPKCRWMERNVVDWDENHSSSDYERWEEWPTNITLLL